MRHRILAADTTDPVDLCEIYAARADYSAVEKLSEGLMARGDETDSPRDRAFASAYLGSAALAKGNLEKGFSLLSSARDWAKDNANDTIMALALNGLGIYYVMSENNTVVALRFLDEARRCARWASTRLLAYRIDNNVVQIAILRNDTTMLDYAVRCFEEAEDLPAPHARYITARHIARLLILKGDYERALSFLDHADRLGQNDDRDRIAGEMLRGEIYNRQNRLREAEDSYCRALGMSPTPQQRADAYIGLARVALTGKRYAVAKEYARKVLSLVKESELGGYEEDIYELLAQACAGLGEWQEAYEYTLLLNESIIQRVDTDNEYIQKQITTAMQVEKKEQEAEMRRKEVRDVRRRNIILLIALCIVAALSVILTSEIRKKNRLYRRIVRQLREEVASEPAIPETVSDNTGCIDDSASDEEEETGQEIQLPEEVMQELWDKLKRMMEEKGIYRSQGLTRESLAKMLGTNRTYLSKIIFAYTGMGYTQLINTYRINEAIRILSDKSRAEYPLKALSQDIGFSSITTFYRLFKQRTGMTPSTFRKNS